MTGDGVATDEAPPTLLHLVGHGAFLTAEGDVVEPSLADIEHTQAHIIQQLEERPGAADVKRGVIFSSVEDSVVARALYIDELLIATEPPQRARLHQLNGAMRRHYLTEVRGEPPPALGERWFRGVDPATAALLESEDIELLTIIESAGEEYVQECREADVPVPDTIIDTDNGWVNRGLLDESFLEPTAGEAPGGLENELWSWESAEPRGVCLALPRWDPEEDFTAKLFGLICLGTSSSKACFFDNPKEAQWEYPKGEVRSIDDFVGGVDLLDNEQGACTDCHAGENPFVVHPDMAAFEPLVDSGVLYPDEWMDPLIGSDPDWPDNPGPLATIPPPSDGQGKCTTCHNDAVAGRYPMLSTAFPGYCGVVLRTALDGSSLASSTMPPSGFEGDYTDHIDYLNELCGEDPRGTFDDDPGPEDDPELVSRPTVEQMYLCADTIGVSRARFEAEVQLLLDGSPVTSPKEVRDPNLTSFDLTEVSGVDELDPGQAWTARQRVPGEPWSEPSEVVSPREYGEDYPGGLPAPAIVPTPLYDCGQSIAVTHVPGATLHVQRTGGEDFEASGGAKGWTAFGTPTPLDEPEELTVQQSLCGDMSPLSEDPVQVQPESLPFRTPAMADLYEEQQLIVVGSLVHGTILELTSSVDGLFAEPGSFPTSKRTLDVGSKLGRPLQVGETIEVLQQLCDGSSTGTSDPALGCSSLPAPEIVPPSSGDTEVVLVGEQVPGQIIRISSEGEEIGDSGGKFINLSRPVGAGEVLRVMRELTRSCRAERHFLVEVF